MKHFVLDLGICNGCYCCQIVCKDEHVANDWMPLARPQPDVGQFWIKVNESIRGTVPKVKVSYFPQMCMHCTDAACMRSCKTDGAIYRRDDGLVIIDPLKCTGCKSCQDACAYDAIYFNEDLNIAQKCTGCAHLLDDGWKAPRCVDACPTQALRYEEADQVRGLIAESDSIKGESPDTTLVHYVRRPRRFVAGTVYDPVEKEVVIGARCTLRDHGSGEQFEAQTDDFGDFWFNDVAESRTYALTIQSGSATKTVTGICSDKDVNLGDIPMGLS